MESVFFFLVLLLIVLRSFMNSWQFEVVVRKHSLQNSHKLCRILHLIDVAVKIGKFSLVIYKNRQLLCKSSKLMFVRLQLRPTELLYYFPITYEFEVSDWHFSKNYQQFHFDFIIVVEEKREHCSFYSTIDEYAEKKQQGLALYWKRFWYHVPIFLLI